MQLIYWQTQTKRCLMAALNWSFNLTGDKEGILFRLLIRPLKQRVLPYKSTHASAWSWEDRHDVCHMSMGARNHLVYPQFWNYVWVMQLLLPVSDLTYRKNLTDSGSKTRQIRTCHKKGQVGDLEVQSRSCSSVPSPTEGLPFQRKTSILCRCKVGCIS